MAYAATADWDGFSDAVSADLKLAVSKVTLKTTTDIPAGNPVTLTLSHTYGGYDVSAGACTGQAGEKPYTRPTASAITGADKDTPKEVFSFYALTNGNDSQTVTMKCVNREVVTEDITLAPGKHLVLTGDVGSGTTQNVGITATISDMWAVEEAVLGLSKLTDETVASASLQGGGTDTNPYLITSAADFKCYLENNYENSYVRLDTDIEIATDSWTPVSVYIGGTFNGNNHTISGTLNCAVSNDTTYAALFGYVSNGTVCNLNVEADIAVNGSLSDMCCVGGIAGYTQLGTIDRCTYSGKISGSVSVTGRPIEAGGIVGCAQSGKVSNCTFSGEIVWTSFTAERGVYVGGIVGYNSGSDLTTGNDYSKGNPSTLTGDN